MLASLRTLLCITALALLPAGWLLASPLEVIVTQVGEREISDPIESLGTLRANESAELTATITETIAEIRFRDGQRVRKGDVLVALTNREQLAELAAAEADLEEARRQYERVQDLAERGQESRAVLDQRRRELDTARARLGAVEARLSDRLIMAPFDGVLGLRNVSVGSLLTPGSVVTTIQDDSVMKLDFAIPEIHLTRVVAGLRVEAHSRAYPEEIFFGQVTSLSNQVDPVTRAFQVRAEIPNPDRKLRAGMLMTVTLASDQRTAVVIPEEAVLSRGRNHHVLVIDDNGDEPVVRRREIDIGRRLTGRVEILDGLEVGERIVIHGGFRLGDGDTVAIRAEVDDEESLAAILSNGRQP
jgi:membrane fusion protein, multidrug efflux system